MTTSPLPITVVVGYQRPRAMLLLFAQLLPAGENSVRSGSPWLSLMCPPAKKTRPSGRSACPEQNSQVGLGTALKEPDAGSQTCGFPFRPTARTFPLGSRITCTPTIGHDAGAVQVPLSAADATMAAAGVGGGVQGTASLARATTCRPSRRISTVPRARVSISCSLTAGSSSGAAATSTTPVS